MSTRCVGEIIHGVFASEPKKSRYTCFGFSALEKIGNILRNSLFLPWFSHTPSDEVIKQIEAKRRCQALQENGVTKSKKIETVREFFSWRDIEVHLEGPVTSIFKIRLFETKKPIEGRTFQLFLFFFYGHKQQQHGKSLKWDPQTIEDLGQGPLYVLKAIHDAGIKVDSLFTASLGNITCNGLDAFATKNREVIPSTLVINRGLTSVQKVGRHLYSFPVSFILSHLAKWSGWDADPEKKLLDFLSKGTGEKRKVVIIEAEKDHYFSQRGSFAHDFHHSVARHQAEVVRVSFMPALDSIERAHHAISLSRLVVDTTTKVHADTTPPLLSYDEKMSRLLTRNIFISGQKSHTCFYVCGNQANADTGTIEDALPLLNAWIKEAKKLK